MSFLTALESIDRKRAFMIVCICLLPFLSNLILPQVFFQRSVADFFPNTWNDQVSYGRQISTVSAVGGNGGYYTVNEKPAAASFTRLYVHGPTFPLLYGTLGRLTGWTYPTGLWLNAVFVSAALAFFIIITRLDTRQCLTLAALYLTSWVLHLYSVSLMQEAFHHAAALVFAGIFFHLLRGKPNLSWPALGLIMLFTLFVGLMRLSWMLLCVPLLLCLVPRGRLKWMIGALFAAGLLIGVIYLLSDWIAAPGLNSIVEVVSTTQADPGSGFALLAEKIAENATSILENADDSLRGLQFFQILILLGASAFHLVQYARAKRDSETPIAYWIFVPYVLISIIVLSCALYLSNGFLRIFALPLFVCVCLLIAYREYRLLIVLIAMNVIWSPAFATDFKIHEANFKFPTAMIQQWQDEARSVLIYQEEPPTPWCNTILMDLPLYDHHAALLPPEFGVTWFNVFPEPMKSRYYYSKARAEKPFLQERTAFSFGGYLYENTDVQVECVKSQPAP